MAGVTTPLYWSGILKKIRKQTGLSQGGLADLLKTDQPTISRWERCLFAPSAIFQQKIEALAGQVGVATLHDAVAVVAHSPFPMILVSREMMVIAASISSGFEIGKTTIEQTAIEEQSFLERFSHDIAESGFWEQSVEKMDYAFEVNGKHRRAVLVPVVMQGIVYALVQKA